MFTQMIYLFSAICFILALKGLSSPKSARSGNMLGIAGMVCAIGATFAHDGFSHHFAVIFAILVAAGIGAYIAIKIPMTDMPQLVAGFHSLVGLAAVFVAYAALFAPESFGIGIVGRLPASNLFEMSLGASIGAITFTGSIIAFAKLQGLMPSKPLKFFMQQYITFALTLGICFTIFLFCTSSNNALFHLLVLGSLILGILLIVPVGGADMPVIVSMLNSYSGWAAAGIGFTLGNNLLIITGALVGASGAILSYVMCAAMNRSIINVIFGAFFASKTSSANEVEDDRQVKVSNAEDAAYMLSNSANVIIVPGYGMAVAQAQHVIREMTELLESRGVNVRFAIHPVAGRMPGHMNVLLAEANIDYEKVQELEEINSDFKSTDVALVIGANDVTNPAAKNNPESPIYGMPILSVEDAKTIFFIKRSMNAGYAGIENELFYHDNTLMLFGDAKKVIEEVVKALNEA
ncbi:MAG UNVERIFIED_CONTAM: NAD(P)(+) transhydrogenase (Re/Si-specific) subunit beta [Rickettsiaceae bacterium]|jgi:NAD(P) transhydrogenase subunit beta